MIKTEAEAERASKRESITRKVVGTRLLLLAPKLKGAAA
jgi:hypothetical protein